MWKKRFERVWTDEKRFDISVVTVGMLGFPAKIKFNAPITNPHPSHSSSPLHPKHPPLPPTANLRLDFTLDLTSHA